MFGLIFAQPQSKLWMLSNRRKFVQVLKRDGSREPVDFNKILRSVERAAQGLDGVDPALVAKKVIDTMHNDISTLELDKKACQEAGAMIALEPNYSKLAAGHLAEIIAKEAGRDQTFWQTTERLFAADHLRKDFRGFIKRNRKALEEAIDHSFDARFDFFGLSVVYDRYLLKGRDGKVLERPQHWLMRVAVEAGDTIEDIIEAYKHMARGDFLHATPTLFNSGTKIPQLSSCYLTDVPDSIEGIFRVIGENAVLSKFSGGLGADVSRMRSAGSFIGSTKGESSGPIPFIKVMDSAVKAVDQGGKRRGAMAAYMRSWHADIFEFLELKDATGDFNMRTPNIWTANWVPDVFMERVKADGNWSLFDPADVPQLFDLHGPAFTAAYEAAEAAGLAKKAVRAQELYKRMMKTLAETGSGWMCFSDHANKNHPQVEMAGLVVSSSNLCVEILEARDPEVGEIANCNLGSVNLVNFVNEDGTIREPELRTAVKLLAKRLDRVVDRNFYPVDGAKRHNLKWRNIGLGQMGFYDACVKAKLDFAGPEALALSTELARIIWESAVEASEELAAVHGPFPAYKPVPSMPKPRRNSLLIAIAPTASIGSIIGVSECTEPRQAMLFRRKTLSGEFVQVNTYLVNELKALGLWSPTLLNKVIAADGSVQGITEIPEEVRGRYKTAWEVGSRVLIDLAAARYPYIDQAQSLNLFAEDPNIGRLSSMYMYAWEKGIKTTYYLKSRPASSNAKVMAKDTSAAEPKRVYTENEQVACSIENREACEACQ